MHVSLRATRIVPGLMSRDPRTIVEQFIDGLDGETRRLAFAEWGITVEAAGPPDRAEVAIRVRDEGPGFEPAIRARLFHPYVRGTDDTKGAGLGLTICRGLVEAHGGTIAVEPTTSGACVVVTLPVEPAVAAEALVDRV